MSVKYSHLICALEKSLLYSSPHVSGSIFKGGNIETFFMLGQEQGWVILQKLFSLRASQIVLEQTLVKVSRIKCHPEQSVTPYRDSVHLWNPTTLSMTRMTYLHGGIMSHPK